MYKSLSRFLGNSTAVVAEAALPNDAEALAEIHQECFERGWSDGDIRSQLSSGPYFALIARQKGDQKRVPLAFILVRQIADEAEVITIATRKKARRSGLARLLLEATIRKLETNRVKSLFLEVDEENLPALSLYKSLRFKQVGEREGYYSHGNNPQKKPSRALVMQRELG